MTSYDLGKKLSMPMAAPYASEPGADRMHYPSLTLSSEQVPPIKDWKVGKTYTLTITVKQTGQHTAGKGMVGEFDILKASC